MIIKDSKVIDGSSPRPITLDFRYRDDLSNQPVIIFAHGIKGFKDWGHWNMIADAFASRGLSDAPGSADLQGCAFIKFNFSHNGTTPDHLHDLVDTEAFGQNTHSQELEDMKSVIEAVMQGDILPKGNYDTSRVFVAGHSRGGPIAVAAACEIKQVAGVMTWGSVHRLNYAWGAPGIVEQWKNDGVYMIRNSRTGQELPVYYGLYEDFLAHEDRLDPKVNLASLDRPLLVVHAADDAAVDKRAAELLDEWALNSRLVLINDSDHVFSGRHPWQATELPPPTLELVEHCLQFVRGSGAWAIDG